MTDAQTSSWVIQALSPFTSWFRRLTTFRRIVLILHMGFFVVYYLARAAYFQQEGVRLLPMTILLVFSVCCYLIEVIALKPKNKIAECMVVKLSGTAAFFTFMLASLLIVAVIDLTFIQRAAERLPILQSLINTSNQIDDEVREGSSPEVIQQDSGHQRKDEDSASLRPNPNEVNGDDDSESGAPDDAINLSTIRFMDGTSPPHGTRLGVRLGTIPGTIKAEVTLPGQSTPAVFDNLPIKNETVFVPVPLVFLCYSPEDEKEVGALSERLWQDGFLTWMASKDLLPGDDAGEKIESAIKSANRVIIFYSKESKSSSMEFYKQLFLVIAERTARPEEKRYLIPALLEPVSPPHDFDGIVWLKMWEQGWYERLKLALRT